MTNQNASVSNDKLNLNKISDYHTLLQNHDWFYEYSGCSRLYRKGKAEREIIVVASELSKAHKKLYEDYFYYINNRDAFPPNIENEEYWQ